MSPLIRYNKLHSKPAATVITLFILLLLNACQTQNNSPTTSAPPAPVLRSTVAVAFAPDGRLWRLTPTPDAVYVDYSDDNGQTFSPPQQVNPAAQKISVWPENPPAIAITRSGRIHVLYYADAAQKSTSFYSYSDDGGNTFSPPKLISDHADSAMHYMDKMLLDNEDKVYLFWHDRRHELLDQQLGSGVLSLYYAISDSQHPDFYNRFISNAVCSCCRTATALAPNNKPVLMVRMVFPDGVREHALMRMDKTGKWSKPIRVTGDHWTIEACPEHGPALAIDDRGRVHMTWFTLGDIRQGIYYAQTDDFGAKVSAPMKLGERERLPGHPDVLTLKNRVILTWKEFDGKQTTIQIKESADRGASWSDARTVFSTNGENGHPSLISNGQDIFLSWVSSEQGHQIIKL
ncbi:sialidase family protein [Methylomarinum sp. Ch1-1]|uniref:Sialidase family protein n=1 Tax=Methylomarinum roseum TaxID=3067653 RepID=A0AAU7NZ40_9GAMM|nr:sialidase family protein [Methylomarinum sp. Ch1-1]MDP4521613.1 sialidase family protein [Methylomarinum sp. Ch1-1]